MKILSIGEFKNMCNKLSPTEFVVSMDNQQFSLSEYGVNFTLKFPTMIVHTNPSSIYFKDRQNSYIKFERIKHIKKCEDSILGKVFDVICAGFLDSTKEHAYKIIIR